MNVRWKVDSGEANLRQGSLKRQVFAIIGTIITKRNYHYDFFFQCNFLYTVMIEISFGEWKLLPHKYPR